MPNTNRNDNAAITRYMIEQASVPACQCLSDRRDHEIFDGTELAEMGEMKAAGAVAVRMTGGRFQMLVLCGGHAVR